ncbi:hypothetical protein EJB05_30344 [Eragrostis curvula]|uniref:Uncharacterized protein n=1 Tax=Eragrostis curvula TaxID=38414 RepID=A0A5J9UAJ9_9POAL|nr:hypothetical protein EJB05_30344 [Eragrostis curvula]
MLPLLLPVACFSERGNSGHGESFMVLVAIVADDSSTLKVPTVMTGGRRANYFNHMKNFLPGFVSSACQLPKRMPQCEAEKMPNIEIPKHVTHRKVVLEVVIFLKSLLENVSIHCLFDLPISSSFIALVCLIYSPKSAVSPSSLADFVRLCVTLDRFRDGLLRFWWLREVDRDQRVQVQLATLGPAAVCRGVPI